MKSRRQPLSFVAVAVAFSLAAAAASALDLTGVYAGKLSCAGVNAGGDAVRDNAPVSSLQISQDGTDLLALIGTLPYAGTTVNSSRDPEKRAVATITACNNDGDVDGRLETAQLTAKLSSDNQHLSVKLVSVRGTLGSFVCTGNYRRTSTAEPPVSECPVLYSCVCVGLVSGGINVGCGNGGAGGDPAQVNTDVTEAFRDQFYVNGNDTGWVCVPQ